MKLSENLRSSAFMTLSMLGFVVNDLFIKSLAGVLPPPQVMLVRGVMLLLMLLALLWHRGLISRWTEILVTPVILRSVMDAIGTLFFLNALIRLPFANVAALLQFLPMAVTLGAWLFLSEKVGWRRWLAISLGLLGVMIIVQPGLDGFNSASLLMLGTIVCAAARDLLTRKLPRDLPSVLVTAATVFCTTLLGLAMVLWEGNWQPIDSKQGLVLMIAASFLFFGHHYIVRAMRQGDIAYVAPFRYTSLVAGVFLAWVFFDEIPDSWTIAGSLLVVATGLYSLYREIRL